MTATQIALAEKALVQKLENDARQHEVRRLIRWPRVCEITGMSRAPLTKKINAGEFPSPVLLSEKSVAFFEDEIYSWIAARPRRLAKSPREYQAG